MTELRPIFTNPEEVSDLTEQAMVNGINSQFPIKARRYTISVSNVHAERKSFTHKDEKMALLTGSSLTYPVRGDVTLVDHTTGKVVDEAKGFNFGDMYHVTPKHTVVYAGNNYIASNLLVRLPGVFVRHTNTGDLEADIIGT
jgi:hypothetical protein